MKILIVTNVPDGAEDLVNSLDGAGFTIVSKEVDSVEAVAAEASAGLEKNYASIIINTDNPVDANVRLNRKQGIRAAMCSTPNDIRSAKKGRANTIILSGHVGSDMRDALINLLNGAPMPMAREQRAAPPAPAPKPVRQPLFLKKSKQDPPDEEWDTQEEEEQEPEQEQEDEDQPQMPRKPRKGFLGSLKDSLGIVDEKDEEQEE